MTSLVSFVIVLGILIFVHEMGHFLMARLFGVRVLVFSLGFGKRLVTQRRGETDYVISAFPLGGYVRMFGEQPGDEITPEERRVSFSHKPVWQRFGIVFGGPLANLVFALLLFFAIFLIAGLPEPQDTTVVAEVQSGSPAAEAGFKPGDRILAIEGREMGSWDEISATVRDSGGKELEIRVERDGNNVILHATPRMEDIKNIFGEVESRRYLLGISGDFQVQYRRASPFEALRAAAAQVWDFIYLTIMGIVKIFQRVVPASELGGPIRIAEISGQAMQAGLMNLVYFMGLLSVNLGVLNLLPVPVLDGGHLVFLTIEGIRRRPLPDQAMEWSQQIGIALLGGLMLFVFYNDILRLAHRWMGSP